MMMKKNISKKRKLIFKKVLKTAFVALVLLILYLPIIYIIVQSFNSDGTGSNFENFTLKWYKEMVLDKDLMSAISTTWSVAIISTLVSTILGTLFAIGINSLNKKNRKRMILLNNIPVINADIVTGVFLMLVFQILGRFIGFEYPLGYLTMLIAHIFFGIPYVVLSVLPKLNEINPNLYDAALDLGSTPTDALRKIIIPSIASGIMAGMLLAFTMSIDDFVISYFTTGAGVSNFSIWLYANRRSIRFNTWPKAYAYNTIISIGTLTILVVYNIMMSKRNKKKGLSEI